MFNIGDRVRYIGVTRYPEPQFGFEGTVDLMNTILVGVEWDAPFAGHTLDGALSSGRGWWVQYSELEKVGKDYDRPLEEA